MVRKPDSLPRYRVAHHPECPEAPFPMCFTAKALAALLDTVGARRPETGAKGFGPLDRMGFDTIEFDEHGSRRAGGAVYAPDAEWGQRRQEYWLDQPDEAAKLWSGDLHSHPGNFGFPSGKAGQGLGDLGYVEEVFRMNETMQYFFIPILTQTGPETIPTIHPWVVSRDAVHQPMIARLRICEVHAFPARVFNPRWEVNVAAGENTDTNGDAWPALSDSAAAQPGPRMIDGVMALGGIALVVFVAGWRRWQRGATER